MRPPLSSEEYRLLSDQKAADYRSFLQLNPGLLAVTGAIFAAGLAKDSTLAVVLSPLPLLLAVFQLVRNAELQLQLTTYLAVFAPLDSASWERDVAAVRPRYWAKHSSSRQFLRPSGWNVWILATAVISELIVAVPWVTRLPHGLRAWAIATVILVGVTAWLAQTNEQIQRERERWTDEWKEYLAEEP